MYHGVRYPNYRRLYPDTSPKDHNGVLYANYRAAVLQAGAIFAGDDITYLFEGKPYAGFLVRTENGLLSSTRSTEGDLVQVTIGEPPRFADGIADVRFAR